MKKIRPWGTISLSVVLGLSFMTPVVVAEAAQKGFYVGAAVGQSEFEDIGALETACAVAGVICRADDTDTGYRILLGYQFGNYLALEGGYVDLGALDAGTQLPVRAIARIETSGGFVALVPQIPVGDIGAIYGRLGLMAGDTELIARVPSEGFDDSDSSSVAGVSFGAGGAINFGRLTFRVEWERYSFDEVLRVAGVEIDTPDIDLISGSVLIHF